MNRLKMPVWSFAGGLIILQMILVAIIVHGESLTFDEGDHIFAGYMMWHSGDYGLNPEHPPLVKLVAALPLLAMVRCPRISLDTDARSVQACYQRSTPLRWTALGGRHAHRTHGCRVS